MTEVKKIDETLLSGVAALEKASFAEPASESALALLCTEQASGYAVLEDGEVAAYGGIFWAPDEGQITDVATLPTKRRRGFAALVLEALLDEARERDALSVSLEVRESNLPAIRLYEKYGFRTEGKRKNFYRFPTEHALVMIKTLP